MKIRSFSPGDHVVKLDWNNRPLLLGIVTETRPESANAKVLSPGRHEWEYTHDLCHATELPRCTP